MVWKVKKIVLLSFVCVCLLATQTKAAELYTSGNISSTYTTIFRDIVAGLNINDNYVFYRSAEYEYTLVFGDLEYTDSRFSGSDCTAYILTYSQGSYGSSSVYTYEMESLDSFSLSPGTYLVYSDLGHYPVLHERGSSYEVSLLFVCIIVAICLLIRSIFSFTYRLCV